MATPEEMEAAGQRAAADLATLRQEHAEAVALLAAWWKRHYLAAGHKRLGRVLLGQNERSPAPPASAESAD